MPTTKRAERLDAHARHILPYPSARAAFRAFLEAAELAAEERVLLPAFVGWSPREGSGVFDPVRELRLRHGFYRLDDRLEIDTDDLARKLAEGRNRVVVLIHYYGRPAAACGRAVALARDAGALVLEDEAHAWLSDVVGGVCGRLADASIFSLHKLLPVASGGALALNTSAGALSERLAPEPWPSSPWDYDLPAISRRRVENATILTRLLSRLAPRVEPLWRDLPPGVVPQTLPVLVGEAWRDALYERLNARGVGVTSLYHTLVPEISADAFPVSRALSRRILNLPIHQDVEPHEIEEIVAGLEAALDELERPR
jgi:dTDP-4-amino-4,6-dideoxygalactose transaminase